MPSTQRTLIGLMIVLAGCGQPAPAAPTQQVPAAKPATQQVPAAAPAAQQVPAAVSAGPGAAGDLGACPARSPLLRIGGVFSSEAFSPHPMETRFSSTSYTRLHQLPLFGADPAETQLDPAYGAAQSWEFAADATALKVKLHNGLTFNNGEPVTATDVAFSVELAGSEFADPQLTGVMRAFGATAQVVSDREVQINFKSGAVTFPTELSPLVYPLYVVSKKYHSNGEITQQAVDKFRDQPLSAGPYEVVSRDVQKFMTLKAARKDPLLGCPTYERIEYRNIPETGTRVAQLQTGQLDIAEGNRDLIDQVRSTGARVGTKPAANLIGLYFFQTHLPNTVTADRRVRLAATHAIDHQTLAKSIWRDVGVQPWGCTWPPPSEIAAKDPTYQSICGSPYAFDQAKARQLLAEAGFGPDNRPKVKLVFWNNYPEEADLAQAIQPMLNAVGFDAQVERIERAEYDRRRTTDGMLNSIMFFGPGDRATALAGAYSVYGPGQGLGNKEDAELVDSLTRAAGARNEQEYVKAIVDLARVAHDRPYGPGFFAAGSVWFLSQRVPDWGLEQTKGRSPLNLAGLATKRS
jgi:peptide/nickel transport system substrate-binding protein